jgi:glycosyltransferase involved in cell wall biosynthesis
MLDPGDRLVQGIDEACGLALELPESLLRARGAQMRGAVKMRFSWDAVARNIVEIFENA